MNERDIFLAALDKATVEERSEFLSATCGGDSQLRERVEGLLRMHEQTGDFLQKPLVERLAEGVAALQEAVETARNPSTSRNNAHDLGFLSPSDHPGSLGRLGHYEIREVVGKGGMGIVLRAFDDKLHRVVAIKVMAAQLATNAAARKRFTREAQAQAAVSHDQVVTIHAVEGDDWRPYLVMQYVSGLSLQQRLDRDGPLELHEILRIGMQTASGLAAAHAQGLIHRDIKPANILLENGIERVKITDFGLARVANEAGITQTDVVTGTPNYMSPEQAEGKSLDQRTDLFSLGSVLYAMCTGRPPFRASGTMAVLKRVCEQTPNLIRETNAEIPDWLAAIIDKLHAKDPAERFQTAAEVADLLGRHLAHVQHPSVALPPVTRPLARGSGSSHTPAGSRPPLSQSRWAVAAAALLCLGVGLGVSEAAGTTRLAATVIRILNPIGVIVVETDDPAVKVTVEGDGGLVITGAGLEEIRLRPGSYRVQADKGGKPVPLDKNLVEVARGGRAIVRVKLEAPPAAASAEAEKGAFVLLAAGKQRKFDTLAEAVQAASDGDSIEIRGNGPFVSQPLHFGNRALKIRAGAGYRPIIKAEAKALNRPLLQTDAPLVLEGIELQSYAAPTHLLESQAPVYAANCRFIRMGSGVVFHDSYSVRNCQFVVSGVAVYWLPHPGARLVMDNNLITSSAAIELRNYYPDLDNVSAHLTRNTVSADGWFAFYPIRVPGIRRESHQDQKPIRLELTANVFDAGATGWLTYQWPAELHPDKHLTAEEMQALVLQKFAVREQMNVYSGPTPFVGFRADAANFPSAPDQPLPCFKTFADWQRAWKSEESESVHGTVRLRGGNVLLKRLDAPEQVTPDDFRLCSDSAGYRAGNDGKDLGADVDLVGPGAAYERWKKTPEYQQWLNETGQAK